MLLALPSLFFSWEPSGRLPNSPRSSPTPRSVCCPPFNSRYINISPSPADSRPPPPASLLAGLPSPGFSWRSASQTTRALGLNVLHACQFFQEAVYTLGSHINELPWSSQWKLLLLLKNIGVLCCKWWVNPWPPIMIDNGQPNKTGLWQLRGWSHSCQGWLDNFSSQLMFQKSFPCSPDSADLFWPCLPVHPLVCKLPWCVTLNGPKKAQS